MAGSSVVIDHTCTVYIAKCICIHKIPIMATGKKW